MDNLAELDELTNGEIEYNYASSHDGTTESAIALAIIDRFREYNRSESFYPELKDDLVHTLYRLKKQYIASHPKDKQDEILTDAFVYVFCQNVLKSVKSYVGYNPKTHTELTIAQYVAPLMRNAIINASKIQRKYFVNEQNPNLDSFVGEDGSQATIEDIMDIDLHNHKSVAAVYRVDDDYIAVLEAHLADYCVAIDNLKRQIKSKYISDSERKQYEKNLTKLVDKVERQKVLIEEAKGNIAYKPLINPDDFNNIQPDSQQELEDEDTIINLILSINEKMIESLPDKYQQESVLVTITLIGLLSGLTEKQLAMFFNTDIGTIRYYIQVLQDTVRYLADELEFEDDDSRLLNILCSFNYNRLDNQKESIRKEREYRSLQAEITRPQVCRIMKNTLLNYIDALTTRRDKTEKSIILLKQCLAQFYTDTFNCNPITEQEFDSEDLVF